jgi:DNA-binding transcriptional LysR family regulator
VGKKVVLTQAGDQSLYHSTKILKEMENPRAFAGASGRLRLGAGKTTC